MDTNKIIGYILLAAGLLLIVWTIYQSYNIFTAKVSAPFIFRVQAVAKTSESAGGNLQELLQQQMQQGFMQILGRKQILHEGRFTLPAHPAIAMFADLKAQMTGGF